MEGMFTPPQNSNELIQTYYSYFKEQSHIHKECAVYFYTLYHFLNTPIIILSILTSIMAAVNSMMQEMYLSIIITILTGFTTISYALTSFFEIHILQAQHQKKANQYDELVREMEEYLFISPEKMNDERIFEIIQSQLKHIENDLPFIPQKFKNH